MHTNGPNMQVHAVSLCPRADAVRLTNIALPPPKCQQCRAANHIPRPLINCAMLVTQPHASCILLAHCLHTTRCTQPAAHRLGNLLLHHSLSRPHRVKGLNHARQYVPRVL